MLRAQSEDVRKLKEEFAQRQKDEAAPLLYAKLSQVEFQLKQLEFRLSAEKAIADIPPPRASIPGDDWLRTHLFRWLVRWSSVVAASSALLLYAVLRRSKNC